MKSQQKALIDQVVLADVLDARPFEQAVQLLSPDNGAK